MCVCHTRHAQATVTIDTPPCKIHAIVILTHLTGKGVCVPYATPRSPWITGNLSILVLSRYCAQQLTADDYAATFVAASGELPVPAFPTRTVVARLCALPECVLKVLGSLLRSARHTVAARHTL